MMFALDSILSIYSINFKKNFATYKNDTIYFNFEESTFSYKGKKFKMDYKMENNKTFLDGNSIFQRV